MEPGSEHLDAKPNDLERYNYLIDESDRNETTIALFMGRFHSQDQSMHNLIELVPYGKNGEIQMVVETPRGSNLKLNYEPKLHAFTVSRALPLGLIYPYDWGFIPSTKGEDGDPIDALALHDGATYLASYCPAMHLE